MSNLIKFLGSPRTAQHGNIYDGYRSFSKNHNIERVVEYPWALKFLKYIKSGKKEKVLDIGPGPFYVFPQILQYMNYNVVIIDVGPNADRIIKDDICKTNLLSNEFNAVFCINVIQLCYDHSLAIDNIHRILKNNGLAIITAGFSKIKKDKFSRGYICNEDGSKIDGCFTIYQQEIDEWEKKFSKILEIIYWRVWEIDWYVGERLPFPIRCKIDDAQLIGIALQK
jgi:ubiquinone/menaquinone biosynthesis C-methylase UbiE